MPSFDTAFPYLLAYLTAINAVTLIVFIADKVKAMRGGWRIKESTLLGLALLGGSLGGMISMKVARHKIRKPAFKYGLPAMLLIHIAAITHLALKEAL